MCIHMYVFIDIYIHINVSFLYRATRRAPGAATVSNGRLYMYIYVHIYVVFLCMHMCISICVCAYRTALYGLT